MRTIQIKIFLLIILFFISCVSKSKLKSNDDRLADYNLIGTFDRYQISFIYFQVFDHSVNKKIDIKSHFDIYKISTSKKKCNLTIKIGESFYKGTIDEDWDNDNNIYIYNFNILNNENQINGNIKYYKEDKKHLLDFELTNNHIYGEIHNNGYNNYYDLSGDLIFKGNRIQTMDFESYRKININTNEGYIDGILDMTASSFGTYFFKCTLNYDELFVFILLEFIYYSFINFNTPQYW